MGERIACHPLNKGWGIAHTIPLHFKKERLNLTSIKLTVNGAKAWATVTGSLTSGMVGLPVTIEYDEAWDGLTKNLVCRCSRNGSSGEEYRSILNVENTTIVAHEVMQAGMLLYLGVEGYKADGTLVIPTVWAMCGAIEKGANTGDDLSSDPTLPVWGQLQAQIKQLNQVVIPQEMLDEIQDCANSATQAALQAARSKESAAASSSLASDYVNTARNSADLAHTYAENADTSANSAANLANSVLQAQRAAEAAAERAETAAGSVTNVELTVEVITVDGDSGGEGNNYPMAVTGLLLDLTEYSATVGGGFYINPVVLPTNATNRSVSWESDNTSVATVDFSGYVACIAEGEAVITCTSDEGGFTATCAVSVAAAESDGGDSSGGTTGGKIQYTTLDLLDGGIKADGSPHTLTDVQHVILPYTEGMVVRSMWKPGWDSAHCPLVLLNGGEYSQIADYEFSDFVYGTRTGLEATLTGLPDGSTIIVNFVKEKSDSTMVEMDYYWYTPGGEK